MSNKKYAKINIKPPTSAQNTIANSIRTAQMLIALAPTGAPTTYKRTISKDSINTTLQKRVSCLKYLKNCHLGKEPWLDSARVPRIKWNAIYQAEE